MAIENLLKPRFLAVGLVVFVITAIAFGYAAANVVPESGAGEGAGTISGYTIANIDYTLLASDPTKVSSVTFDATPTGAAQAPDDVRISVNSGTTWITCSGPTVNNWACAFALGSEPSVSTLTSMQVVAAQ